MKIIGKIYTQTFSRGKPIEPYGYNAYFGKHPKRHIKSKQKEKDKADKKELKKYTVWVGGTEITDFFVTYSIAKELLKQYNALGYTDVIIQEGR